MNMIHGNNQKAKQRASRIEKPCRAWNALEDARSVWDDMSVRALGMCGWDDAGQHARDEICDATMIAVSSGGTYRTWTCRRHTSEGSCIEGSVMPDSIVSTSKLRLISKKRSGWFQKKCGAVTTVLFFLFLTHVTKLVKNHSWSAERNAGNGDLHMVRSCCGNLYENENILSYLRVHIVSEAMVLSKPEWDGFLPFGLSKTFGLSKKCEH